MMNHTPVTDQMQAQIDAWEASQDRRAIFLTCYHMMTCNMLNALEAGEFHDAPWVGNLLVRFAEYYFEALEQYTQDPQRAPVVWRAAFDAAQRSDLHVIQHLLLGVNAHICYDLVFTLGEMLPDWMQLDKVQRNNRYQDHCHVNEIIYRTLDAVQDEVVARHSPWMQMVDLLFGRLDEKLLHHLIVRWREQVWASSLNLVDLHDGITPQAIQQQVEVEALRRAEAIVGARGLAGLGELL